MRKLARALLFTLPALTAASGCNSPFYTDKGALVGGLTGTGVGAITGAAVGHPGVGALVGAGVGTLTGAAVGSGLDNIEARNRAEIAATLGRQVPPGNVTLPDVVAMSKAGVNDQLIVNHIRTNGLAHPLQSGDLITLQNSGVSTQVIGPLQSAPQPGAPAMVSAGHGTAGSRPALLSVSRPLLGSAATLRVLGLWLASTTTACGLGRRRRRSALSCGGCRFNASIRRADGGIATLSHRRNCSMPSFYE